MLIKFERWNVTEYFRHCLAGYARLIFFVVPCGKTSMLNILRQKRFEPFLKMNIDEGGGGEIVQKLLFLTRFSSFRIAPMFYLILPPPLRILP